MNFVTMYEINGDPLFNSDVTVQSSFQVEINDDDSEIKQFDGSGIRLDVSAIPNFAGNSTNFQVFETYSGSVAGVPVTFALLQFSPPRYILLAEGTLNIGDQIVVTNNSIVPAFTTNYSSLPDFVCFTKGALILTPEGTRKVEDLGIGDNVVTGDGRHQPVRWIGRCKLSRRELAANPKLCPIEFKKDSLGKNYPERDLIVSPQHRIAIGSHVFGLYYGCDVMLAPAIGLVNGSTITKLPPSHPVEYIHIMLDKHELVYVDGIWTESLFPGDIALSALSDDAKQELFEMFPDIGSCNGDVVETVLPVLTVKESQFLIANVPNQFFSVEIL